MQRVLRGLSSSFCWVLIRFSVDLEWGNQGATMSKTTKEHCQVMLFKGEVLFLSQGFGLMPASCSVALFQFLVIGSVVFWPRVN